MTRQQKREVECGSLLAFNHKGMVIPVMCKNWSCKKCAKTNAQMWAWRVHLHIEASGHVWYFWTFTLGSQYKFKEQGYEALPRLWDNLRKYIQRRWGVFPYCAFVEGQPRRDYMPHFHVLAAQPSPIRIKDLAVHVGFGHQAKQEVVSDRRAGAYVAKYASKSDAKMPMGFRRVRVSRGWTKLPEYHGFPLLIKSKSETTTHFLERVAEVTDVPLDDLWDRWSLAMDIERNED